MRRIDRLLRMKKVNTGVAGCSLTADNDGKTELRITLRLAKKSDEIVKYFNSVDAAYKQLDEYIKRYGVLPSTVFIIKEPNNAKGRFNNIDAIIIIDDLPDDEE